MNYLKVYEALIAKRRASTPSGYSEKHHIVPRSMGGGDDRSNLVRLTAREHFFAHLLLAKIHGGGQWAAVFYMMGNGKDHERNFAVAARTYEIVRMNHARHVSKVKRGVEPWNKGRKFTDEERERYYGNRATGGGSGGSRPGPLGHRHTDETKKKMRDAKLGKKHSRKHNQSIGSGVARSHASPEMRAKISAATKLGHMRAKYRRLSERYESLAERA